MFEISAAFLTLRQEAIRNIHNRYLSNQKGSISTNLFDNDWLSWIEVWGKNIPTSFEEVGEESRC
jgi:hypothetical protein